MYRSLRVALAVVLCIANLKLAYFNTMLCKAHRLVLDILSDWNSVTQSAVHCQTTAISPLLAVLLGLLSIDLSWSCAKLYESKFARRCARCITRSVQSFKFD